ncbi:MAG: leucine-rich repeat domain-containing protein [Bacteroidetes bacterium]|nr:leucine-rich repeat domain-containing protein [Bacteroidota bacterium]
MNSLIKINIVAIIFAVSFSAKMNADCTNPLVITDVTNPPVITEPTCIKFDESITEIPDSIYSTDYYPERGGNNITGVIGENVVNIGSQSFFCYPGGQIAELSLPNVEVIGDHAFLANQITELSLPNVVTIGDYAFYDNQITELNLPNIETIGMGAFEYNQITELNLPNVVTIGDIAFAYNHKITELNLPNVEVIGDYAFLVNKITELNLPNVEVIGDHSFSGGNQITELSLPNVVTIGRSAFASNKITELSLPNVVTIGDIAFASNKITELNLSNVVTIGYIAFAENQITEVILPNVTTIGNLAFRFNPLKSVVLGTDFTIPKLIKADSTELGPFYAVKTEESDLILGEFVLPERDGNKWNGYTWKSITILGITEKTIATYLTISPNPTYSDAIISFCLLESCDITFEICDVLGNVLYTISNFYDAGEHKETLNTSDLLSGNYICRMLAKNKQIASEKFAVVR